MIVNDFKSFPPAGRLIGIDWGMRRIGIAVSDERREFVFVRPVQSGQSKIQGILDIVRSEKAVGIVLGLPVRLNGDESETTANVRAFAAELATATDVPIILFDESLTSFEAETRGASDVDSESARVLLENAIAVMRRM
jgi:putative Holliday junction resolvase